MKYSSSVGFETIWNVGYPKGFINMTDHAQPQVRWKVARTIREALTFYPHVRVLSKKRCMGRMRGWDVKYQLTKGSR